MALQKIKINIYDGEYDCINLKNIEFRYSLNYYFDDLTTVLDLFEDVLGKKNYECSIVDKNFNFIFLVDYCEVDGKLLWNKYIFELPIKAYIERFNEKEINVINNHPCVGCDGQTVSLIEQALTSLIDFLNRYPILFDFFKAILTEIGIQALKKLLKSLNILSEKGASYIAIENYLASHQKYNENEIAVLFEVPQESVKLLLIAFGYYVNGEGKLAKVTNERN